MTQHILKTWPRYWHAIENGSKTFELRVNDRDFNVGDELILRQWDNNTQTYLGTRNLVVEVTYVLSLKNYLDIKGWRWTIARWFMPPLVILGITKPN